MAVTPLTPKNKPPENLADSQKQYRWKPARVTLADDQSQIVYTPFHTNWRATTIILSGTTGVSIKITASSNDILNGDVEDEDPLWADVTITDKVVVIPGPITAVDIINESGGEIVADVL